MNKILRSPAFLPGLLFFFFNASTSYAFYHVNSYKMVLLSLVAGVLFVWDDLIFRKDKRFFESWKAALILSVPTLLSLPGYLIQGGIFNYNFDYELSIDLMALLWSVYLFRRMGNNDDIKTLLYLIGATFVYAMVWAVMEYHQFWFFEGYHVDKGRIRGTFGNYNYFSAAIAVLFPVFFVLGISFVKFREEGRFKLRIGNEGWVYAGFCVAFAVSIYLTSTRSAQVGLVLGTFGGLLILFASEFPSKRKLIAAGTLSLAFLGVAAVIAIKIFEPAVIIESRYGPLFYLFGWIGRFKAWEAAINAIAASPVFGFGLGSSYSLYFQFVNPNSKLYSFERSFNHVHSEYLETAEEAGILGAAIIYGVLAWILFKLYCLSQKRDVAKFDRYLAIGLIAGLLAYGFHGIFSVAQRMVVAVIPFFTVLTLSLCLMNRHGMLNFRLLDFVFKIPKPLLRFGVSGALVMLIAGLYGPWAYRQHRFVEIGKMPHRSEIALARKLGELMDEGHADVYALDRLANLALVHRMDNLAGRAVEKIDGMLPNYRTLGLKKSDLAARAGDWDRAGEEIREYLKLNRYDRLVHPLYFKQIVATRDFDRLPELLTLGLHVALAHAHLEDYNPENVKLVADRSSNSISLEVENEHMTLGVPERILRKFMADMDLSRTSNNPRLTQIAIFSFLDGVFSAPYFDLPFKEGLTEAEANYARGIFKEKLKGFALSSIFWKVRQSPEVKARQKQLDEVQNKLDLRLAQSVDKEKMEKLDSFYRLYAAWLVDLVV